MEDLKTLLDEVASEARRYDVIDRAVTRARRRRRWTQAAPVAAGLAMLVFLGGGWLWFGREAALPPAAPDAPGASAARDWLPASITVPVNHPTPLPTNHGVGAASLAYQPLSLDGRPNEDPGWILVTPAGKQYWIEPTRRDEHQDAMSLSPDGRWLLLLRGNSLVLRDLTGTTERPVNDRGATRAFWSPDGRWLALYNAPGKMSGTTAGSVTVSGIPTGPQWTLPLNRYPDTVPVGVLDDGELILAPTATDSAVGGAAASAALATIRFVDPASTRQRRQVTVDLTRQVTGLGSTGRYQLEAGAMGTDKLVVRAFPRVDIGGGLPQGTVPLLLDLTKASVDPLPVPSDAAGVDIRAVNSTGRDPAVNGQWRDLLQADDSGELLAHFVRPEGGVATVTEFAIFRLPARRLDVLTTVTGQTMGTILARY
jgi:hypothetical protein